MKSRVTLKLSSSLIIDIIAVLFIYFLGDISRLIGYPMYILDPMRMMVILAIAFTPRWNGYILAILLPLVSHYLGAHPHLLKSSLMLVELLINVGLFWFLFSRTKISLLAILLSIIFSKTVYYLLKYIFLHKGLMSGELMATPFDVQVITTISFSLFIFLVFLILGQPNRR
ncbi:MAG: hypothetical protein RQ761_08245 [Bacteroidales bacterium]|nr:hypothetical protein [Bacteroidales bacterium]